MAQTLNDRLARWFLEFRGIRLDTLERFGVYSSDDDVACFPYPHGDTKLRAGTLSGEKKRMWWEKRLDSRSLYGQDVAPKDAESFFMVEGETDFLRLSQALHDAGRTDVAVYGLSGVNWWRDEFVDQLAGHKRGYTIFDNDDPYTNKQAVDATSAAWLKIRKSIGPKVSRVALPGGVKDVCEFFSAYDFPGTGSGLEMLAALCRESAKPKLNFNYLDLSLPIPEYEWLVEGFMAFPDISLVYGRESSRKSWFSMALAAAIVTGERRFLGMPLNYHGPVLYFDQENPEDVVRNRFAQLGVTPETPGYENLKIASFQFVDVMRDADRIIEDLWLSGARAFFVDSFSTTHSLDENNGPDMTKVMQHGYLKIARSTGAAGVVVHHSKQNADEIGNASRGSTAIIGQADFGLHVAQAKDYPRASWVSPYKPRRGQDLNPFLMQVEDYESEGRKLTRAERYVPDMPL